MPELRLLTLAGPLADSVFRELSPELEAELEDRPAPLEIFGARAPDESILRIVRRDPADGAGLDVYVQEPRRAPVAEWLGAAARVVGGRAVASRAREAWRIELGVPRFGVDITPDNLPQETGLVDRAVSFDKGCYTGQEVVARIRYRGHVNRQLRGLRLGETRVPLEALVGAELYHAGRSAGRLTSVADSPRFGLVGLGIVRREAGPGARLTLERGEGVEVEVVALPFTVM